MKSTKAEIQQRVEAVLKLRLAGAEFWDIVQYAAEREPPWEVCERQLRNYISQADELMAACLEKDREKIINRHIAQRRTLFARAISVGDNRTALAVLHDECELLGLYPSKKLEMGGKDGGPIILHITEEIVGQEAPATLDSIEEVVTHDDNTANPNAVPQDPAAPSTGRLPQE